MAFLTQDISDILTSEHIDSLNKANIWTVNDFCSTDLMAIKRLTNIKYHILKDLQKDIKNRYTIPCNDLHFILEKSLIELKMCPTGIPELTMALEGGLQTQEICELSGDSGTGKTELCYLFCGEILSHYKDHHILFITSHADFDIDKIAKYTKSKAIDRILTDEDIYHCLERVSVARPNKLPDLVHLLNTIVHADRRNTTRCIIIDSLSFILQDDILEIRAEGEERGASRDVIDGYLCDVMRILTTVAINKNVILVVTNSNQSHLSYYKSWTNGIDHRIHLSSNPRKLTILKTAHNISKINLTISFEITDEGIFALRPKKEDHS